MVEVFRKLALLKGAVSHSSFRGNGKRRPIFIWPGRESRFLLRIPPLLNLQGLDCEVHAVFEYPGFNH